MLKELPAFDLISVESLGNDGGIESTFMSNKKYLVKYNLTEEIIQAMINITEETKIKIRKDSKLKV